MPTEGLASLRNECFRIAKIDRYFVHRNLSSNKFEQQNNLNTRITSPHINVHYYLSFINNEQAIILNQTLTKTADPSRKIEGEHQMSEHLQTCLQAIKLITINV